MISASRQFIRSCSGTRPRNLSQIPQTPPAIWRHCARGALRALDRRSRGGESDSRSSRATCSRQEGTLV
jgi:hypothetical protein